MNNTHTYKKINPCRGNRTIGVIIDRDSESLIKIQNFMRSEMRAKDVDIRLYEATGVVWCTIYDTQSTMDKLYIPARKCNVDLLELICSLDSKVNIIFDGSKVIDLDSNDVMFENTNLIASYVDNRVRKAQKEQEA